MMLPKSVWYRSIARVSKFAMMIGCVLLTSTVAWGQASVNEGAETAYAYVDGTNGSDSNPGTQQKPFQTIIKAVSVAQANTQRGLGTRVTVNPGTYRESITMNQTPGKTTLPITLEAATDGTVVISGADVWAGWQVYGPNNQIFTHTWPYQWGFCTDSALPPGQTLQHIVLRREMIFVNGEHLTQVLSLSDMQQGTFYVSESSQTAYIWPASGTDVGTATIEVAVRPQLLTAYGETNLVFRGLNFQYASSCRSVQPAVNFSASNNILLDSDNFVWNNAVGARFDHDTYITVQNSKANHNGEVGWVAYKAKYELWDSDEGSYNNWRGAQGANYALTTQGADFLLTHNSTFTGLRTLYNQAHGVHWDTDALDVTVDSLLSSNNYRSAAVIEASEGPVTIENSQLCDSNIADNNANGGMNLTGASNVTLTGNTIFNNRTSQIMVTGSSGGISVKNWETGQLYQVFNEYTIATGNIVVGTGNQQVIQDGYLTKDWPTFASTLTSDYNTWWNASDSNSFTVPVPKGDSVLNFTEWKTLTQKDGHSAFKAPSTDPSAVCQVNPDATDYWFVVNVGAETIAAGNKASYSVTVVPLSFSGTVSLSADVTQVPASSASLSPNSINTSGSSTLTVATSGNTPPGTYPVTMIAQSGGLTRTITVSLIVQ